MPRDAEPPKKVSIMCFSAERCAFAGVTVGT